MIYLVTCTYGTKVRTWTFSEALEWLRFCGPQARVTRFGRFIAGRQHGGDAVPAFLQQQAA